MLQSAAGLAADNPAKRYQPELIIQTAHSSAVTSVSFSPNGKFLASGSADRTIKLWDAEAEFQIKTLGVNNYYGVTSVAFSSDSKMIAGSANTSIVVWDTESGAPLQTFNDYTNSVNAVIFAPGDKTLFSGGDESQIKIWDIETGNLVNVLKGHTSSIRTLALSPDGKTLASGGGDATIRLWDAATGAQILTIRAPRAEVNALAFSPDGKSLASGGANGTLRLWNAKTGALLRILTGHRGTVESVAFSRDGKTLASGSSDLAAPKPEDKDKKPDNTVRLWNAATGAQIRILDSQPINSIAFSKTGDTFATGSADNSIKIWDTQKKEPVKSIESHVASISSAAFSPATGNLALGCAGKVIKVWNIESGRVKTFAKSDSALDLLAFSADGKIIVSSDLSPQIKVWDAKSGSATKPLDSFLPSVRALGISPDAGSVAVTGTDGKISLLNVETAAQTNVLEDTANPAAQINSISFSPTEKILATGDSGKLVKLWNRDTGYLKVLYQNAAPINKVSFSPDGKTLAVRGEDNTIVFLSVETGAVLKSFKDSSSVKPSLTFLQNDNFFVTADGGTTVKLWSAKQETPRATLTLIDDADWVVVMPDGHFDASESSLNLLHYTYGLEIIELDQLKVVYYDPGLMQKVLGFNKESIRPVKQSLKDISLYPEIIEQRFDPTNKTLTIKLRNRGGGIGTIEVYLNGKRIIEDARDEPLIKNPNVAPDREVTLTVNLPAALFLKGKENQIKVVASNFVKETGTGDIQSRGIPTSFVDPSEEEELPNLYAIVGGVSDYTGDIKLRFAAKDAEDFSSALKLGAYRLFCPSRNENCLGKVDVTTLTTSRTADEEQPTKENFKKAFAEVARKAKPNDFFVLYLSGHGVTLGTGTDSYFYLTKEARSTSREDLYKTFSTDAISNQELIDWLTLNEKDPADIFVQSLRQVIILDTCAAGNFAPEKWKIDKDLSGDQIRAMDFIRDKTGTFILMGSSTNRPSYETNRYNQGLLTFALLEGMQGHALQPATGNVEVSRLFNYAAERVPELARGLSVEQLPVIKQPSGNSFVFAQMSKEDKEKIILPKFKPIFSRPQLGTGPENDDTLHLGSKLRKRLDAESSYEVMKKSGKGEPVWVYVDDEDLKGAVRLTGSYVVNGNSVVVEAYLRRDSNTLAKIRVESTVDAVLDDLLAKIYAEISKIPVN